MSQTDDNDEQMLSSSLSHWPNATHNWKALRCKTQVEAFTQIGAITSKTSDTRIKALNKELIIG